MVLDHPGQEQPAGLDPLSVRQRIHVSRRHHAVHCGHAAHTGHHRPAGIRHCGVRRGSWAVHSAMVHTRHPTHTRHAPLLHPALHLGDLRALGGVDLSGQIDHPWVDIGLAQDDVAHLDRLLVMGDHHVGEVHVGLVVHRGLGGRRRRGCARGSRRGIPGCRVSTRTHDGNSRESRYPGAHCPGPDHNESLSSHASISCPAFPTHVLVA